MTFIYSFFLSLAVVIVLSLVFREEAVFWLSKISGRFIRKEKEGSAAEKPDVKPIEKFCGFREWSEKGGEMCTIFQLEDGSEYKVTENICRQCQVWDRYQAWLDSGKKENFSVTLAHTFKGSQPMVVETDKLNPEMEKGLTFNDFIIKRRRVPWAGKAAIAFFTLFTYLIVYFSGIFTNPVVWAMPDAFFFTDDGTNAAAGCWNMLTTAPASAANTATQCHSTNAGDSANYCALEPNVHNDTYEADYAGPKKLGWMTVNNATLTGDMPADLWAVAVTYNFTVSGTCTIKYNKIQYKIWKASANLASSTTIVDWTDVCAAVSAGTHDCNVNSSPGAVSLDNQVIHLEFRQFIEYSSCGVVDYLLKFSVDLDDDDPPPEAQLTTPTYSAVPEKSIYFAIAVPFIPLIIKRFRLRDYFKKTKVN